MSDDGRYGDHGHGDNRDKSPRRSWTRSRSKSRSPQYSRSPSRSRSRSRGREYSRSPSPRVRRSPSGSRSWSRSRSKSPPPRYRRRSYSRSSSRSRSPSYSRSHRRRHYYRSYSRSRSRSRSRSGSYYRRGRSRSYSPGYRRYHGRNRSRSPLSNRKRHDGNRYNPNPARVLGVFGLSLYTAEKDLRELFSKYGPVEEVQVVYDHQTGRSRGFAFVYFEDCDDAVDAKEHCNGLELDGRRIRVDYSITKRPHTPTPGVYMGKPTHPSPDRYHDHDDDYYDKGGGYEKRSYSKGGYGRSSYYY